jgi:ferredoxin-NADP reductase
MEDSSIACHCTGVTQGRLKQAIIQGATNFEQLVLATDACTQCGSCAPYLHELLGKKINWTAVEISKIKSVATDIKSFKLIAKNKKYQFDAHQPGQYILVKAYINEQWVTRPYALSAARSITTYREITVRKKPEGVFTQWLFDGSAEKTMQITDLQGTRYIDISSKYKSFCFSGGVGITPIISACRSIKQEKLSNAGLHIDYSVSDASHIACETELKRIIKKHSFISLNIRVGQRISLAEIVGIVKANDPDTQYYVIGPNKFETYIYKALVSSGVAESAINDLKEKMISIKPPVIQVSHSRSYTYIGMLLLCAFLIQEWFGFKVPVLETLQQGEGYKRWTGFIVLSFIAFQWYYPIKQIFSFKENLFYWQKIHKYNGVIAPIILYAHATSVGYAYLFILSTAYLSSNILALCNRDVFNTWFKHRLVYKSWLSVHVLLTCCISILVWYHLFFSFAYS